MKFWLKKVKERNYLKNLRVDGSLVSTRILRKYGLDLSDPGSRQIRTFVYTVKDHRLSFVTFS